jgi:uncharacterized protein YndB with AHSA1/START domain
MDTQQLKGTFAIVVDYELSQPPEEVWRCITESELVAKWLMSNDLVPIVGHRFTFRAKPMGDWDGIVYCEVMEAEVNRRFVYSWRGKQRSDGSGYELDTVVEWTLHPKATGGTVLHLEHRGFADNGFPYQAINEGWQSKMAGRLREVLDQLN